MSTTTDILADLKDLIKIISDLLKTQTAIEAPKMARELGVVPQLNAAVDFFVTVLNTLAKGVDQLHGPLLQADAALAGLEVIADGVGVFGQGEAFADLTLIFDLPTDTFTPLTSHIGKTSEYLKAGLGLAQNLPSQSALREASEALKVLADELKKYKFNPEQPTPAA